MPGNSPGPEQKIPSTTPDNKWQRLQELEGQTRGKTPDQIARDLYARELMVQREKRHRAIDKLTGLYAPFMFNGMLERAVEGVARGMNSGLGLTLLDIDDFGLFNKLKGKPAGDRVLTSVGGVIKRTIRKIDIPFREGGEEEAVLMPYAAGASKTERTHPAERLRKAIGVSSTPEGERVTVSIGTTDYLRGESPSDFYIRADRARRIAKKLGKDRTVKTSIDNGMLIAEDLSAKKTYSVKVIVINDKGDENFELTPVQKKAA